MSGGKEEGFTSSATDNRFKSKRKRGGLEVEVQQINAVFERIFLCGKLDRGFTLHLGMVNSE
ncbi:hypothetical protein LFE_1088 [Leptospirillum ferrooxidans C2-3]|jgi:hypothetical protein|uniref:Uncharacterized protein n=1 Tax=Leptospirillum ferrooxidans (strain C2-3) TaxID=1162668 RepID=I0IND2_LEPFC|nr:hypothetical protein LFE_1088 [Leptospirillum ferrooxidans C2-3]